jgi:hypothetical protein
MKPDRWSAAALTVALLVGLLAVWNPASPGQAPEAKPAVGWEYKTFFGPTRQGSDEVLNRLGEDGWELVAIGDDPRGLVRYVLKRPKRK